MDSKKVFVVHGRNEKIRKSMFSFLRSIGLEPLEWSQIVDSFGKTNPYIGEVLDHGFSISQATVILMTPDDEAKLRNEFLKSSDPLFEQELTPQPRQNVLLEAGMALGKFPDQTIIVQIGALRQLSDLLGRHVIRFDGSSEQRHELSQRLKKCHCDVDTTGKDWFTEGDFSLNPSQINIQPPMIIDDDTIELAAKSNLTNSELDDVLSFPGDSVELLHSIPGPLSTKQKIGTLCILSGFHMVHGEDWVSAKILTIALRDSGILDKSGNLTTNLKRINEYVVSRGKGNSHEFKLTTGKSLTFNILHNLSKNKPLDLFNL